jgi:aspartyl-tRNA(Asn)/glutamyl-tRNA(Gln) amidotransferase subunit A
MTSQLHQLSATELSHLLQAKEVSSEEITKSFIENTERLEGKLHAFISYDAEYTLDQARASDRRRQKGSTCGPLDGIPISIKDIICENDQPLT